MNNDPEFDRPDTPQAGDIEQLKALRPTYTKKGRPTQAEREAAGFPLKKKEWLAIWNVRHGRNWGGRRRGAGWGKRPRVHTKVKMNFMIPIELAQKLNNMPRGVRSQYVSKALDLLCDIEAPEHVKPKKRGKQAHWKKPEGWQQRPHRMNWIEKKKLEYSQAEAKLRDWKAKKMALQQAQANGNLDS